VAIWKILFLKHIKIKLRSMSFQIIKTILPASGFISIPRIFEIEKVYMPHPVVSLPPGKNPFAV
jgi:hypothetical protein